ncbi:MAG TPA: FAD-dependent oxidoreductase [Planctomycetota bacterium]|nr:FAD-dependent oxidoreductase [Planctomycetota bacterium]
MTTTPKMYDTVVLGSTLAGLGAVFAAAEQKQRVLLIEAGTIAGQEFVETLQMHTGWALPAGSSAFAKRLHTEAVRRKIVREATCDTAAFSCLLQEQLAASGADALYMTDLTGVQRSANGFAVTFSNRSGIATAQAGRLLDATPEAFALRALNLITAERPADRWVYRGLLIAMEKINELPPSSGADVALHAGRYGTDVVLDLAGSGTPLSIAAARIALVNKVATLRTQPAWKNFSLGTTANAVAFTPKYELRAGALAELESAGFQAIAAWRTPQLASQPWAALDAGVAAARQVTAEAVAAVAR